MANLNLSEFGENTSVSDADYTFVWDSANSISKKVSRNSWLNSGTLTSSAPVTISQTWDAVGQTFTALKVNAAGTSDANSASGSLLADFQVNNVSKSKVDKGGFITAAGVYVDVVGKAISSSTGQQLGFGYTSNGCAFYRYSTAIASFVLSASVGGNSSGLNLGTDALGFAASATGALSVVLLRDGADNTLALRNGAAAQTFNVYGTWTTAITNFERLAIKYNTTDVAYQIAAEKGTDNGDYRPLQLWTGGASRLHITTAGNVGIGTTAPSRLLSVVGNLIGANLMLLNNTNSAGYTELGFDNDTAFAGNLGGFVFGLSGTTTPTPNDAYFFNRRSAAIFFGTNSTERMRITAAGNVGIGTTSPTSKLQVTNGDVEIETVTSGIIMKAAGTSTRYRITLNAGGTALVFTAI